MDFDQSSLDEWLTFAGDPNNGFKNPMTNVVFSPEVLTHIYNHIPISGSRVRPAWMAAVDQIHRSAGGKRRRKKNRRSKKNKRSMKNRRSKKNRRVR